MESGRVAFELETGRRAEQLSMIGRRNAFTGEATVIDAQQPDPLDLDLRSLISPGFAECFRRSQLARLAFMNRCGTRL